MIHDSLKKLLGLKLVPSIFEKLPSFGQTRNFRLSKEPFQDDKTHDSFFFVLFVIGILLAGGIYFGIIPLV